MDRKIIYFCSAVATMIVILLLPLPDPISTGEGHVVLSTQGKASLAVLAMVVILWMTEAIPFPIAGLVGMASLVIAGASGYQSLVKDGFGSPVFIFFI